MDYNKKYIFTKKEKEELKQLVTVLTVARLLMCLFTSGGLRRPSPPHCVLCHIYVAAHAPFY